MKKNLYVVLALSTTLAACGQTQAPTSSASTLTRVSATAQGWTGGAATVDLYSYTLSGGEVKVGSTSLSDKGAFTLTLPDKSAMQPALATLGDVLKPPQGQSCTSLPTISDGTAMVGTIDRFNIMQNGQMVGYLSTAMPSSTAPTTQDSYAYFYSDRAVTLKGKQNCVYSGSSGFTTTTMGNFNMTLASGWNVVHVIGTNSSVNNSNTVNFTYETTATTDFPWYAGMMGAQPASLKSLHR